MKTKKRKRNTYDFVSENKEISNALNQLEKAILKSYGRPCRSKAVGCPNCRAWTNFDALKLCFY